MGLRPPSPEHEAELILRAQRGERSAFDGLVALYQNRTYQFALRLCGNPDDAADLVADTFVRAFRAIRSFRSDAALSTWLFKILSNVYLDMSRRERHRRHVSLEAALDLGDSEVHRQVADEGSDPQELAELSEQSRALLKAIRELPHDQRLMVLMYHTEGKSYEEIAEAVGHPIGTVKSRLHRARMNLRKILSGQAELFQP
ncbi:MAG: RNA polymerase sigma24 factor [Fimbriimonadales bacterium]